MCICCRWWIRVCPWCGHLQQPLDSSVKWKWPWMGWRPLKCPDRRLWHGNRTADLRNWTDDGRCPERTLGCFQMTICAPSRQVRLLRTVYCVFLVCVPVCVFMCLCSGTHCLQLCLGSSPLNIALWLYYLREHSSRQFTRLAQWVQSYLTSLMQCNFDLKRGRPCKILRMWICSA